MTDRNMLAALGSFTAAVFFICVGLSLSRHEWSAIFTETLIASMGLALVWKRK